ncbi:MAG: UDP-3-O-(3-hydroxymyristoyl)glucosamine N-acyltransferase [Nitrospirae bacterium]|nr:UDP-3-O-(3-hydroxymyristoyl)glucosamine N-acyltransferase [Nitrospirota bacterium]
MAPRSTRSTTLSALAAYVGGSLRGGDVPITGVAGIREAEPGQITFVANPRYVPDLARTRASAVVIAKAHATSAIARIEVDDPYYAFSRIVRWFHERPYEPGGISPHASLAPDAAVGADPTIGPFVSVGCRARLGDRVTLLSGVSVGDDVAIGDDTVVYPNVTIREGSAIGRRVILHSGVVIGSDGFGFATRNGRHEKILQIGRVVIEDDVELGANVCVDRAALGVTLIKRGTKVDNLVQIAHNVVVGEDCLIVAQAGISGSSELGRGVVLAGQVGVVGHLRIGDGAIVGAQSGVASDLAGGQVVSGSPAIPHQTWLRVQATIPTLPEMRRALKRLEARVAELEQHSSGSS